MAPVPITPILSTRPPWSTYNDEFLSNWVLNFTSPARNPLGADQRRRASSHSRAQLPLRCRRTSDRRWTLCGLFCASYRGSPGHILLPYAKLREVDRAAACQVGGSSAAPRRRSAGPSVSRPDRG